MTQIIELKDVFSLTHSLKWFMLFFPNFNLSFLLYFLNLDSCYGGTATFEREQGTMYKYTAIMIYSEQELSAWSENIHRIDVQKHVRRDSPTYSKSSCDML